MALTKITGEGLGTIDSAEVSNSADTPTRAIITAEDSSGSDQNAFIKTKAKGSYYEGLEMASTDGHIGMWGGYYSSSAVLQARVGGSGINSSDKVAINIDADGNVKFPQLQNLELTAVNKVPHIKSTDQLTQLADDAWITVASTSEPLQGLLIVTNYNTGHTGIFRHEYASSTTTLISGDSGQWANSDSDGYLCVYTGVNSYHVYIKNRQGAARDVKALFLGTYQ